MQWDYRLAWVLALAACDGDDATCPFALAESPGRCVQQTPPYVVRCDVDAGEARGGCPSGHACRAGDGYSYCDPECDDSLCEDPRSECGPGQECSVYPDNCGRRVACLQPGEICDVSADKCFPRNGDCTTAGCPNFTKVLQSVATSTCGAADKICHVDKRQGTITWLTTDIPVQVLAPQVGSALNGVNPRFSWTNLNSPMLLRVLSSVPTEPEEFDAQVIWGASAGRGASQVPWNDGYRIDQGVWAPGTPTPLRPGTYYFVALAVSDNTRLASSAAIPFYVGDTSPWRSPGDECFTPGIPGDCENPSLALTCQNGTCRKLCASHVDCAPGRCGDTEQGVRVCN